LISQKKEIPNVKYEKFDHNFSFSYFC